MILLPLPYFTMCLIHVWKSIRLLLLGSGWKNISFDKIKPGDMIRVNVGFSPIKRVGIVRSVHDTYLWCDTFNRKGLETPMFTASKSYGRFERLNSPSL